MKPRNTPGVYVRFICISCFAGWQSKPTRCHCGNDVRELSTPVPAGEFIATSTDARQDLRLAPRQKAHPAVLVGGGV